MTVGEPIEISPSGLHLIIKLVSILYNYIDFNVENYYYY